MSTVNFKTIFESLPAPYLVLDPDLRVVAMTRSAAQRSPKPAADLVGKSVHELLAMKVFDSTNTIPIEAPVYAEDGSLAFIIYCGENVEHTSGLNSAMGAAARQKDVSDEMCRAESLLVDQRRHFESLLRFLKKLDGTSTLDDIVKTTRQEIELTLGLKTVWFYTLNDDEKYFELQAESEPDKRLGKVAEKLWIEGDPLLEEIVRSEDIVIVDDARTDPRTNKSLVETFGNRSIFNVPIQLADRKLGVLGTGTFGDEGKYRLSVDQSEYLIALGQCVAITLDRLMSAKQRIQDGEAFRGIEARLHSSLKVGHISLWELNLATDRMQFTSESTDEQGLTKSEISFVDDEWKQQLHTDDHPRVEQKLQSFLSGSGKVYEDEFRVLQKDGQHRWVRTQGDLERDDSGHLLHITGYQIDIHERKLMEEALLESESNLRLALKWAILAYGIGISSLTK